jgi:hypothetical protein
MEVDMTMSKLILLGLAAPLGLATLASEAMTANSAPSPLTCAIRATPGTGGTLLEAVATASEAVSGTYRLRVGSGTDDNSNAIVQGGAFEVAAGRESVLSTVLLGGEAGQGYEARLKVEWPGGSATCKASGPGGV